MIRKIIEKDYEALNDASAFNYVYVDGDKIYGLLMATKKCS